MLTYQKQSHLFRWSGWSLGYQFSGCDVLRTLKYGHISYSLLSKNALKMWEYIGKLRRVSWDRKVLEPFTLYINKDLFIYLFFVVHELVETLSRKGKETPTAHFLLNTLCIHQGMKAKLSLLYFYGFIRLSQSSASFSSSTTIMWWLPLSFTSVAEFIFAPEAKH